MTIKNSNFYKKSKTLKEGVSVSIHTKNSENDLKELLPQLINEKVDEINIIDENSTDETINIAKKFTNNIVENSPEIGYQRGMLTIKSTSYKYLFSIETDQRIFPGIINKLKNKLKDSENFLIHSRLEIKNPKTLFEKFFYHYQKLDSNRKQLFAPPFLTYNEFYKDLLESNQDIIASGAGVDTSIHEIFFNNNLKFSNIDEFSIQKENYNLKNFYKKFFWYGIGDYNFYKLLRKKWTIIRKIKSLSHVFRKYFIILTFKSFIRLNLIFTILIIIAGIIRYYGFIYSIFKRAIKF